MMLYAIKKGQNGDRVRARTVRPDFPLDNEFLLELENPDFDNLRLGDNDTVRSATDAELQFKTDKQDAAELRRAAVEKYLDAVMEQNKDNEKLPLDTRNKIYDWLGKK